MDFPQCPQFSSYGNYAKKEYCKVCAYTDWCKEATEASKAPLGMLSQYLTSKRQSVRKAAKARFIELEEEL